VANSGLPYVILRLGGVMSRDMLGAPGKGGAVIGRAIPADNRIHMVDARDVALALDDDECSSALPLQYSTDPATLGCRSAAPAWSRRIRGPVATDRPRVRD